MNPNELQTGKNYKIDDKTLRYRNTEPGYQWTNYVFDVVESPKDLSRVGEFYVLSPRDVEKYLTEVRP